MLAQDLGRAIDYLVTRPDIQAGRIAFFVYSAGGMCGTILPTTEPRLKVSVLVAAGLAHSRSLPETDPINFAPCHTLPTLLLNGRYNFMCPLETSQRPLFELLGAPPDQKRHVLLEPATR
jgi:dienelactone hydrolase